MTFEQKVLEVAPTLNKEVIDLLQAEINMLWYILLSGLAGCCAGFVILVGWIMKIQGEIKDCVTFKWIEEKFEKDLNIKMDKITKVLEEIKIGMLGTFDKQGLVNKHHELADRVDKLEKKN